MLRIENVNTGYEKKQVLFDVSLEVNQGDIILLIGTNGSGKSTLLKAIFGLNKIWSGHVFFNNENITNPVSSTLLKKGLLYLPQKNNLFEQLTVKENLEISGFALDNKALFKQRLDQILIGFSDLKLLLNKKPLKLSGGERQQLVLAMAMLHQPKLLLLDEPFTGLAGNSIKKCISQIEKMHTENKVSFVIVEHKIQEAFEIATKVVGMKLGRVLHIPSEKGKFDNLQLFKDILI